jgi:hypothetical protein
MCEEKLGPIVTRSLAADDILFFQPIFTENCSALTGNDILRRKKVVKITYFLLRVPFSMFFFRKFIGPTVTVYSMWAKVAVGQTVTL